MKSVDVCLSPELLELYPVEGKVVVVADILRATSCMTTAFAHGASEIIPVSTVEECLELKTKGYLTAAERNGEKVEGFEFGNSPFSYMNDGIEGAKIAVTTTNGTMSINKSKGADEVIIGSFLNLSTVIKYLLDQEKDVLILCAGWKGRINLEDTLFAGAVVEGVKNEFLCEHDGSIVAHSIYLNAGNDKLGFLSNCSHFRRLSKLNIGEDIEFCMKEDVYNVIPVLQGDRLIKKELKPALLEKAAI